MRIFHVLQGLFFAAAPLLYGANSSITYLALGDSIPFGMNPTILPPYAKKVPQISRFVGYPEIVTQVESLGQKVNEINAACPGETSGSFLNTSVPDFGCNSPHPVEPFAPPFKTIGLHENYTGPQMAFALSQLVSNPNTKLVTLSIGANDIILALPALEACGTNTTCQNGVLGPVLTNYATNLGQILGGLRSVYSGKLILLTYYSPLAQLNQVTQALNATMVQVATQFSATPGIAPVLIADGFLTFQAISAPFSGDACAAGLLIRLPPLNGVPPATPCDIHPSPLGQTVLAGTIELVNHLSH